MKKDLKAKFRRGISAQYSENKAQKDSASSSSGANNHVFNQKALGNRKMISFKDGDQLLIRFVPYETDETHPLVKKGKMDAGDPAYMLGFDMHVVGEDNASYLCPRSVGHKCPICEKASALYNEGDSDAAKTFRAKRRVLYNIVVLKNYGGQDATQYDKNEVLLLHESQYLFEKGMLDELQKGGDEDEEDGTASEYDILNFCVGAVDPEDALALKVMCSGKKMEKKLSFKVLSHKSSWDSLDEEAALDQALPLHKLLNEMSYDELESNVLGAATSEDEEDDDDEDDEERESIKKSKKSKRKPSRDEDEEDEDEEDEDEDEDDKPVKKSKKSKKEESEVFSEEDADDDDEPESDDDVSVEDDDDEGDEGVPSTKKIGVSIEEYEKQKAEEKAKKEAGKKKCPAGYRFGKDLYKGDECDDCELYDECRAYRKELRNK